MAALQMTLVQLAEARGDPAAGYTHCSALNHLAGALFSLFFWPLQRDRERLAEQVKRIAICHWVRGRWPDDTEHRPSKTGSGTGLCAASPTVSTASLTVILLPSFSSRLRCVRYT